MFVTFGACRVNTGVVFRSRGTEVLILGTVLKKRQKNSRVLAPRGINL